MNIVFSDHALFQMNEREILKESVLTVLVNPDKTVLQTNFRKQAIKIFRQNKKRYLLIVIYEENHITRKVVTAFVSSKIKKYLSN